MAAVAKRPAKRMENFILKRVELVFFGIGFVNACCLKRE
jgi:hypothetical protein